MSMPNKPTPPDFDDMFYAASEIAELMKASTMLDLKIKLEESNIIKTVSTDEQYFQNGKPPSMEFVKSTWKFAGLNNELVPLRVELAVLESKLEKAKLNFQVLRDMVSTYITESANHRATTI